MRARHKIPAVFSIYMVDVLCCALGCVILLWQLYHQESETQTAENAEIRRLNDEIRSRLNEANLTIVSLNTDKAALETTLDANKRKALQLALEKATLETTLDATKKKTVQVTIELEGTRKDRDEALQLSLVRKQELDAMKKTLTLAEATLAVLRVDLKNQQQKSTLTAAQLAEKIRSHAELFDRLAEAEKKIRALTKDLAVKEADTQVVVKRVEEKANLLKLLEQDLLILRAQNKDTAARLSTADIRTRLLEQDLERGKKELLDVNRRFTELASSQDVLSKRMMISVKDLETAKLALAAMENDKISLIRKAKQAENRFAGVALTGQRVIFLVDMSGSMAMVDDNTFDPDKWPTVCDTVARLMSSLPQLREFQIIVFSDKVQFALGNEDRWLTFEPEVTPKRVAETLKAIKPTGGTDMHAAFQQVFRFRDAGLDTVYFFSDGLPNLGEGTPANADKLNESQLGEILGKHIRNRLKNTWNRPIPNQPRVRINCIGFFFESPDVGAFLWALAREHDGSFVGMSKP